MRTCAPIGPPAITRPSRTSTRPPCVGQRRRLAEKRQHLVAERQGDRDGREDAEAVGDLCGRGDARRPGERPDRAAVQVDPRVAGIGDPAQLGLVPRHDRPLERERGRELRGLNAKVRAQRLERRGADTGATGERGGVLLPVAAARVAVERHRHRDDQRRGEQEDEHGVAGDRGRGQLSCTRSPGHVRSSLRRTGRTGTLDHASADQEPRVSPGRVTVERVIGHACGTTVIAAAPAAPADSWRCRPGSRGRCSRRAS